MGKTIVQLAKELDKALTTQERNGEIIIVRREGSPDWMQDVIFKAHGDRMPSDDVYDRIAHIVSNLSGLDDDADEDAINDCLNELEPDVYTPDLTKWLHDRNDNIYYLETAIQNGARDGFQLLAMAQYEYIYEIANALVGALREQAEIQNETEEMNED